MAKLFPDRGWTMGRNIGGWIACAAAFGTAFFIAKYGVGYVKGEELGLTGTLRDAFVGSASHLCSEHQLDVPENASIPKLPSRSIVAATLTAGEHEGQQR